MTDDVSHGLQQRMGVQELGISVHHKEEYYRLILLSKNKWDVPGNNVGTLESRSHVLSMAGNGNILHKWSSDLCFTLLLRNPL